MKAVKVQDANSTRMMDAAMLLLDTCRAIAAEGPTEIQGDELLNRTRGIGSGLACCIASVPDPEALQITLPHMLGAFNAQLAARLGPAAPRIGIVGWPS